MYRSEHPNPQFRRENWRNLNGTWQFDFDFGASGRDRRFYENPVLTKKIEVPFCPESRLSGIGYTDFMPAVWYRRGFSLSASELNGRVLLHFGAVDYYAYVYVNGKAAGSHVGGYTAFCLDITALCHVGENDLVVCAEDDTRKKIPCGKQSKIYPSHDCDYTRSTGIWQTVWLEFVPRTYIERFRLYPDILRQVLRIEAVTNSSGILSALARYENKEVGTASVTTPGGRCALEIPLSELHLWEVGKGRLYDLTLSFGEDKVFSYFGMRSVRMDGMKFLLNEKSVFQRLVLDQGYYPDGIYTAPTEEDLYKDIELSMAVGFNGARLHQKIFEPLFLYHCDRLGYLVWGEYPSWGIDYTYPEALYTMLPEWMEEIERDFNHPAIIGWCPFNETREYNERKQWEDVLRTAYRVTKEMDRTRPCIDTSGYIHVETDIFDLHDYDQDPIAYRDRYLPLLSDTPSFYDRFAPRQIWRGEPVFISEYGGIQWSIHPDDKAWGYGEAPKTEEEFKARFKGLADAIMDNGAIFAVCYTQLYDIEQEQNGLYTYDRKPKFQDMDFFRRVFDRPARIEK